MPVYKLLRKGFKSNLTTGIVSISSFLSLVSEGKELPAVTIASFLSLVLEFLNSKSSKD